MKLNSLHIQNFRALEDFEVKKLGRLNLIVGKNNSGKSSVLEALRIYAGEARPSLLAEIAKDHDEKYYFDEKDMLSEEILPFESFFTGRCFASKDEPNEDEKVIRIGEIGKTSEALQLQHVYMIKTEVQLSDGEGQTTKVRWRPILKSELGEVVDEPISRAIRVSKNDLVTYITLDEPYRRRLLGASFDGKGGGFPCSYVPTQLVEQNELADLWDKVALTEYAENVKTVLKFIEGDFEDINFVKDEARDDIPPTRRVTSRSAKVKLANLKQPVPLNSMGDGMLRVLQLALKVILAKGGFVLIDEFENGLHYSVQEKVWKWLFDLAEQRNIQVFATTHSWDCVESFCKVANAKKDVDGVLFRVGRSVRDSDKGRVIATEFDEEQLARITQMDVDVR